MKYSIRRLGCTSWSDTNSLDEAIRDRDTANRIVCTGHVIINNETGGIVIDYNY